MKISKKKKKKTFIQVIFVPKLNLFPELKFGLRGGKPRSKINKMKKSTTEEGSIPFDLPKPVEEAD